MIIWAETMAKEFIVDGEVILPAVVDLRVAKDLKESLMAAVEKGGHVIIRGQDVERLSTPCLQILISASKSLECDPDRRLQLLAPSEAMAAVFQDLGLETLLEEWS